MGFFDFIFQHSKKEKNTSLKIPVPNKFIHTNHDLFSLIPADVLSLLYIQENIKHNKC